MRTSELHSSEYDAYYRPYLDLVPDSPLTEALAYGLDTTISFFDELPMETWTYRYAPDKWTPKDILQHLSDTERVFSYRALSISRNPQSILPGFDENVFADAALANEMSIKILMEEFIAVRKSTISLFRNLDTTRLKHIGIANSKPLSARAAGFIICGHEIHHCNIIKERYLA
ncbi:MAG TPA: DinB family protein [Aequorivita sp.]|nr:DinB family protein [Aequorivita sp.]